MHACELVDLAGIVAVHASALIRRESLFPETGLDEYWTASKCRLDRWGHTLKRVAQEAAEQGAVWHDTHAPFVAAVVEEIFCGEILTRVWAALVAAHDRRRSHQHAEPIARSVLIGHLEARHRVLCLLAGDRQLGVQRALRLDSFRRRCDRWSDMLLGYLAGSCEVQEFAVDPQRARDFAADMDEETGAGNRRRAWPLLRLALQTSFHHGLMPSSPNADLNARIAAGILGCLPGEAFDSTGLLRTLCALRMSQAADDVQGMIEEILLPDARQSSRGGFVAPRWRRFK